MTSEIWASEQQSDEDHDGELAWLNESIDEIPGLPAAGFTGRQGDPPVEQLLMRGQLLCRRFELQPDAPKAENDLREARSLLRVAAGVIPIDHIEGDEWPGLEARITLAMCCSYLHDRHGASASASADADADADAEEAIEQLRAAVPHALPIDPVMTAALAAQLAELLWGQALEHPDATVWLPWLAEAADLLDLVVHHADDAELRADALVLRALVAIRRWACDKATDHDPHARAVLRSLLVDTLREVPADHHSRWQVDWTLADLCHGEYIECDDVSLLEQSRRHWESALAGARRDGPPPAELLGEYASTLTASWHRTGSGTDRDQAIALFEEAISDNAEPDPMWLLESGLLLATRYSDRNPDPDGDHDPEAMADLDASAHRCSIAAVALAQAGSELARLAELEMVLSRTERLRFLGDDPAFVEHIDRAIEVTEPVLAGWTGDAEDRVALVYSLGFQKLRRFLETVHDEASLASAVDLLSTAYHQTAPDEPEIASRGLMLAFALNTAGSIGLVPNGVDEAARLAELHGSRAKPGDPIHDAAHLVLTLNQLWSRASGRGLDSRRINEGFDVPTGGQLGRQVRLHGLAGQALLLRSYDNASARDLQTAATHSRRGREASEPGSSSHRSHTTQLALALALAAGHGWEVEGMPPARAAATAIDLVTEVLPGFPPTDPSESMARFTLSLATLAHAMATGSVSDEMVRFALPDVTQHFQQLTMLPGHFGALGGRIARFSGAMTDALLALLARTPAKTADALRELRAVIDDAAAGAGDGVIDGDGHYTAAYRLALAQILIRHYDQTQDRSHLVEAIEQLHAVRESSAPNGPLVRRDLGGALATAMRKLAEHPADSGEDARRQSRAAAIAGLGVYGELAVLQSSAADAAALVREAGAKTATAVAWCLADQAWPDAVLALEAGRALTLKAALTWASVPERLRLAGNPELASEWELTNPAVSGPARALPAAMPGSAGNALLPSDLPARAIAALGNEVVQPPQPAAIGAALRTLGRDALVYLVPGDASGPGHAVIVDDRGDVTGIPLPQLVDVTGGVLDSYHRVHDGLRAATEYAERRQLRDRWITALDELTAWAWTAAMEAILPPPGTASEVPRLVIVPVGRLSGVPWHAARSPYPNSPTGRPRYALDSAVVSYAASARLLLDCAARLAMPIDGTALIVGNPSADPRLAWAGLEATALWRAFYHDGDYYGTVADLGDGRTPDRTLRECTPLDLLAALPGGTSPRPVVHLSCHAGMPAAGRTASVLGARLHLGLGGRALSVAKALRQAAGRPAGSPGPLVDLAACGTHLTGELHDEALTLATAFLAAGAATVLGSLWQVMDRRTALLMFAVHHHLRVDGLPADEALRRGQLWMLDPAREPIPGMPPVFRDSVQAPHLAEPRGWAAFVHQGR